LGQSKRVCEGGEGKPHPPWDPHPCNHAPGLQSGAEAVNEFAAARMYPLLTAATEALVSVFPGRADTIRTRMATIEVSAGQPSPPAGRLLRKLSGALHHTCLVMRPPSWQ